MGFHDDITAEMAGFHHEHLGEPVTVSDGAGWSVEVSAIREETEQSSHGRNGVRIKDRMTTWTIEADGLEDIEPAESWRITTQHNETFEVMNGPNGHLWDWLEHTGQTQRVIYTKQR